MPPRTRKTLEPAVAVDLDLDTIERETTSALPEKRDPFTFQLNGKTLTVVDPYDADYRILVNLTVDPDNIPVMVSALGSLLNDLMSEEDKKIYAEANLPIWKMEPLVRAFSKHFGLSMAPGEAGALPS